MTQFRKWLSMSPFPGLMYTFFQLTRLAYRDSSLRKPATVIMRKMGPRYRALFLTIIRYWTVNGIIIPGNLLIFWGLIEAGAHYQVATLFGFIFQVVFGALGNYFWSFKGQGLRVWQIITRALLADSLGWVVTAIGMWLLVDQWGTNELLARVVVLLLVGPFTFILDGKMLRGRLW